MRNLYLTGLPGSGKTEIGKKVARAMGMTFVESAEDILLGEAPTLTELWARIGEADFRVRERVALLRLAHADNLVVAVTDGALIWENNRVTMNKTGLVVSLDRDVEKITFSHEDHPWMPQGRDGLQELYEDRAELFENFSLSVDNNGTMDACVEALCEAIKKENDRFAIDWSQYQLEH